MDLPAPLGPTNPVTSPSSAVKLSESTAIVSPYRRESPSTSIIAHTSVVRSRRTSPGGMHSTLSPAPRERVGAQGEFDAAAVLPRWDGRRTHLGPPTKSKMQLRARRRAFSTW
ncbi:hypothetical protein GCM10023353_32620 [Tomitella cavernea]|uniref:Uncharacterized protein n=1 Tax=Tomitella cavernea TaxID=1387982 RepID=A0ABP9D2R2_9ACTN